MLYIIGGASRSGKTLLARRATVEKQIPYFPLDALFAAVAHGTPELKVRYEDPFIDRANNLWPLAKHLFNILFNEEQEYLIEGDSLIPSRINELVLEERMIKCCFLGYTQVTKESKLSLVRRHHQGDIDWTKGISDEEMLPMINKMIQFSKYLKDECAKYRIKYFDISYDFDEVRNEAFKYLFSE